MLKPHFETLVSTYVFPQLCFNAAKQEQWETDPIEYLRISVGAYMLRLGPSYPVY